MYDDYPADGNIDEVEAWVGDDAERAAYALDVETGEGGKNRSTLTRRLEELVTAPDASEGAQPADAGYTPPQPEPTPGTAWDEAHRAADPHGGKDPDAPAAEAANRNRAADHFAEAAEAGLEPEDLDEADRRIVERARAAAGDEGAAEPVSTSG